MKVVLLAAGNSIHTVRWANGLVARGLDVHLISAESKLDSLDDAVAFYRFKHKAPLGYLVNLFELRNLLNQINPDLMNAHYATGYGLLANLSNFTPVLLSVWGSDVYEFPNKSILHNRLLRSNLKSAAAIASTSHCMAYEAAGIYSHKQVYITPFGVDENIFSPTTKTTNDIVFGTIKTLESKYGVDILIQAFFILWERLGSPDLVKLEITGGGSDSDELKDLVKHLGLSKNVIFHGEVDHSNVPKMLNRLDVYCAFSRFESFGVAVLEACACEKPVIVSDASGLKEVTLDKITGFVVPKNDVEASADAMMKLVDDGLLRKKMGQSGRKHILENYTWEKSLDLMINAYKEILLSK